MKIQLNEQTGKYEVIEVLGEYASQEEALEMSKHWDEMRNSRKPLCET